MASFRLKLQRPFIHNVTDRQLGSVHLLPPSGTSAGRATLMLTNSDTGKGFTVAIDRWEAARIAAAIQHFADTGEVLKA